MEERQRQETALDSTRGTLAFSFGNAEQVRAVVALALGALRRSSRMFDACFSPA